MGRIYGSLHLGVSDALGRMHRPTLLLLRSHKRFYLHFVFLVSLKSVLSRISYRFVVPLPYNHEVKIWKNYVAEKPLRQCIADPCTFLQPVCQLSALFLFIHSIVG